ncbi:MAG: acyltransferase family protein [Betaproteobacteria bacterium]
MDDRRYFGLDALRGTMMMLGIVLHGAMFYLSSPPLAMPGFVDRNNSAVFDVVMAFIHSFRMPTFFVVAGFFTALLVEKRGVAATYKDRARRVLAPLVAGFVTIMPLTLLFMLDFQLAAGYGSHRLWPDLRALQSFERDMRAMGAPQGQIPLMHLWFLYYLCYFYLLIPVCRFLIGGSLKFEARIRRWLESPLTPVLLALATAATLWPYRGGQVYEGFLFLKPHLPSLIYYGSFFVFGYFLYHYRGFLQTLARRVPFSGVLSGFLFPLATWASSLDNAARGANFELHLAAVLANGACTWALACLFLGSAQRWFDRESPWIQYVSQSSYWVFLVHMPLVAIAGWWLVQYDFPSPLKFLLVCGFTAAIAFLTFHYWVQKTWLSVFLHGRRFDLKWPWLQAR